MGISGSSTGVTDRSETRPESAGEVLSAARERRRTADLAEADLCRLAVEWVVLHPEDALHDPASYRDAGGNDTGLSLAGPGAPTVAEYAVAEFAAAVGLGPGAGKWFLGECLELRYRLPRHWDQVVCGRLPAWKARRVARETIRLTPEAAAFVDAQVAPVAGKIRPAQLDRTVNEAIGRYMPAEVERLAAASWDKRHVTVYEQLVSFTGTMTVAAELDIADALDLEAAVAAGAQQRAQLGSAESLDVRRAQAVGDLARGQHPLDLTADEEAGEQIPAGPRVMPRVAPRQVVLHVHLSHAALAGTDPVARLERGNALVTAQQVRSWCGRPDTGQVIVKPVIDLEACIEVDSDQVPDRIKEQVALRDQRRVLGSDATPRLRSCDEEVHQA
jgi:hypothetical protein